MNSVAHYFGEHTFDDARTPKDHFFTALVTLGEGYHNFHHEFPNGIQFITDFICQIDTSNASNKQRDTDRPGSMNPRSFNILILLKQTIAMESVLLTTIRQSGSSH